MVLQWPLQFHINIGVLHGVTDVAMDRVMNFQGSHT